MAKTKKQKDKDDALAWLRLQGDKAFKAKNKKEVDTIAYLIREMLKPDYRKEIIALGKYLQDHGSINFGRFRTMVQNPNAKPKVINQKANKRT